MHFSNIVLTVMVALSAVSTSTLAAPMPSNNATAANIKILNYALTLEHLEAAFYKAGLAKFNASAFTNAGFGSDVLDRFVHIGQHENDHVSTLTSVINSMKGGKPVAACTYNFPMNNVSQFLAVAQALENTGVSAYLGAASNLTGSLLTAAASITTVEARHSAYLNELMNQTAFPYSFDTPLGAQEVVTIASNFIKSCPYNLGVTPFNQLTATLPSGNSTMVTTSFQGNGNSTSANTFCQFIYGSNTTVSARSNCSLPSDVDGYVYVVITNSSTPIKMGSSSHILAGPALLFNGNHASTNSSSA